MADLRISSTLPAVATPTPARSVDVVRAAQRAFFDAALNSAIAAPSPPAKTAAPTAALSAPPAPARPTVAVAFDGQERPARPLRPGSLLDIRV